MLGLKRFNWTSFRFLGDSFHSSKRLLPFLSGYLAHRIWLVGGHYSSLQPKNSLIVLDLDDWGHPSTCPLLSLASVMGCGPPRSCAVRCMYSYKTQNLSYFHLYFYWKTMSVHPIIVFRMNTKRNPLLPGTLTHQQTSVIVADGPGN